MAIAAKANPCAGCSHAVLHGVACDWSLQYCPRADVLKGERKNPSAYMLHNLSMLAARNEFDAIRSNN